MWNTNGKELKVEPDKQGSQPLKGKKDNGKGDNEKGKGVQSFIVIPVNERE